MSVSKVRSPRPCIDGAKEARGRSSASNASGWAVALGGILMILIVVMVAVGRCTGRGRDEVFKYVLTAAHRSSLNYFHAWFH